jgi:hypothetical protein
VCQYRDGLHDALPPGESAWIGIEEEIPNVLAMVRIYHERRATDYDVTGRALGLSCHQTL